VCRCLLCCDVVFSSWIPKNGDYQLNGRDGFAGTQKSRVVGGRRSRFCTHILIGPFIQSCCDVSSSALNCSTNWIQLFLLHIRSLNRRTKFHSDLLHLQNLILQLECNQGGTPPKGFLCVHCLYCCPGGGGSKIVFFGIVFVCRRYREMIPSFQEELCERVLCRLSRGSNVCSVTTRFLFSMG
jgi:hypothetical protein